MKNYQKLFKVSLILISLAFLIAACGGEPEPVEPAPAEPEATEQAEPPAEAAASEPTPTNTTPPDTPESEPEAPTAEPVPAEPTVELEAESTWIEFSPANNAFSVLLPAAPEESTQETPTALGSVPMTFYTVENISATGDPHFYGIMQTEMPLALAAMTEEQIEETITGAQAGMLTSMGADLVREEQITAAGYPGREIELAFEEGKFLAQILLVENNLYQLMVGVGNEDEFSAEDRRFLASFKPLVGEAAAVESDSADAETGPAEEEPAGPTSEEQTGPPGDQFAVGEAIDLGDEMTLTVAGLVPYEGDVTFLAPEEGFEYVSVEITVDNAGPDTGYFVPFDRATLVDEAGQSYEYDLGASALLTDAQNFESEIPAGQQSTGMISFQAPENAETLTLVIDTTPFAEGGEVSVPLEVE